MLSSDSQRFADQLIKDNKVWANNSGPALFKWRYTPQNGDIAPLNVRCFFENIEDNNREINVIRRSGTNNPVVQTNDIRNTPLNGKVQEYVNPTDPTIFGFRITRASKSDPKEYQCTASFRIGVDTTDSETSQPPLSLQVLGNIVRQLFCRGFKKYFLASSNLFIHNIQF